MSESEVTKHVMRSYRIWKQPGIHWKHKLTEIIIEIFIIVFAVTLSIYFERWREKRNDREIEKKFLTGLKFDLQKDLQELTGDSAIYTSVSVAFKYFYSMKKMDKDSLHLYKNALGDYTQLIPNTNRYEALRSSGKLDVIENSELLDSIVDLYQDKIPALMEVFIKPYNNLKTTELFPFLDANLVEDENGNNNLEKVLKMPVAKNFFSKWDTPQRIAERYHQIIDADKNIIAQIDNVIK